MKKIISTIAVSLLAASTAFAAQPAKKTAPAAKPAPAMAAPAHHMSGGSSYARNYGMSGCGLGSIWIDKNHMQIFSSTTNMMYTQIFAVSSGTSNCVETPTTAKADRMDKYIVVNKLALADDIARGEGETIQGLAQIMNCQGAENLGSALQAKFATIFPSHEVTVNDITDHIITVVGQDSSLSAACGVSMVSAL
ncbi:MAG: DUF3015 family protein [Bdellovibrionales bacterium]|nr:DUF3015 family protein [Bdellovibrionales bacterium]